MNPYLSTALIGGVVGTLSGWLGVHGGEFIQLGLLMAGVVKTQSKAAGTTMFAIMFPISAFAVWDYYKRGDVDIKHGLIIILSFSILAMLGARLNALFSQKTTFNALSFFMLIASGLFFMKGRNSIK